jgi:DNA polymerase-3 subunit alpha
MAPDKDSEQPLETWAKYRKNINLWLREMKNYGLSDEEINWLSHHSAVTDGICESQEGLMSLVQEERLGGHSLNFADKCRKALAKKIGSLFDECEKEYYDTIKEKGLSSRLAHYVWDVLLRVQRGYSFNRSHCLAYSLVALQEMNLAYKYPIVFWNCACLIANSGGVQLNEEEEETYFDEEDSSPEERVSIYEPEDFEQYEYIDAPDRSSKIKKKRTKTTDYKKIATAIGKMTQSGVNVLPPDINTSTYTFTPRVEDNVILYGLSGILNVGEDVIKDTLNNRPYSSPKDYLLKVKPKRQAMISLIKAGAFDNLEKEWAETAQQEARYLVMAYYLSKTCEPKKRITLQNFNGLLQHNLIPQELDLQKRVFTFNKYLKTYRKKGKYYVFDEPCETFYNKFFDVDEVEVIEGYSCILQTKWDKIYQAVMDSARDWVKDNHDIILESYNTLLFQEAWNKYAQGDLSAWEMESLCFYYHEHELAKMDMKKYGIVDFESLSPVPVVDYTFKRNGKDIPIYQTFKIAGTIISKNDTHSSIVVLTTTGVVTVKFTKEYFAMFGRQISEKQEDGTKKVIEKGWFQRGTKVMCTGIRRDDTFVTKTYSKTLTHQLYKINKINEDGSVELIHERAKGECEDE